MESAQSDRDLGRKQHLTPAQVESLRAKQGLLLARSRVQRDLETSRDPRHQKMLSDALADLDQKLSQLENSG